MTFLFFWPCRPASPQVIENRPDDNIVIFWTSGDSLKAVTLMCVRDSLNTIGLVTVPLQAVVRSADGRCTIADTYAIVVDFDQ